MKINKINKKEKKTWKWIKRVAFVCNLNLGHVEFVMLSKFAVLNSIVKSQLINYSFLYKRKTIFPSNKRSRVLRRIKLEVFLHKSFYLMFKKVTFPKKFLCGIIELLESLKFYKIFKISQTGYSCTELNRIRCLYLCNLIYVRIFGLSAILIFYNVVIIELFYF